MTPADFKRVAQQVGMGALGQVLRVGAKAAAHAYDAVLEEVEDALVEHAKSIADRRSRVRSAAERGK